MNRILSKAAPLAAAALLVAGSAFAGGASCGSGDAARSASSGHHCEGMKTEGASAMSCPTVKAGQNIYSFAVPGAECQNCVKSIQTALMAQKGVACAYMDLASHTAYVIADRSFDRNAIAKCIQTAGFKNKYTGQGPKVQAQFAKAMSSSSGKAPAACPYKESKEKDKI
ncbi:MAG TPA: heavy metal-associated domain-containing protein [Candidatus Binatia bacterium]|nr:heavy metal-associated domain-containing protein [Candidatus Binatia bacterium]